MRLVLAALLTMLVSHPAAAVVLGGGLVSTDCTVAFEGIEATVGMSGVVCLDGDPSCDGDGVADGACGFSVAMCTRVVAPGCMPRDITSIRVSGLPIEVPGLASAACGAASTVAVPAGAAVGTTVIARDRSALKDVDYLNLCCRDAARPFDAAGCALAVTPAIAGCQSHVPSRIAHLFERARLAVGQAAGDPAAARAPIGRARRALRSARARARRLARHDDCGNSLGLMASHALAALSTAP